MRGGMTPPPRTSAPRVAERSGQGSGRGVGCTFRSVRAAGTVARRSARLGTRPEAACGRRSLHSLSTRGGLHGVEKQGRTLFEPKLFLNPARHVTSRKHCKNMSLIPSPWDFRVGPRRRSLSACISWLCTTTALAVPTTIRADRVVGRLQRPSGRTEGPRITSHQRRRSPGVESSGTFPVVGL